MHSYRWPQVYVVYPGILIIGVILTTIIPTSVQDFLVNNFYPFQHGNIINEIFAYNGNLIWTLCFGLITYMNVSIQTHEWDPLFQGKSNISSRGKIVGSFLIKFVLKNLLLWIIFLIIDRVFIWTGGHCTLSPDTSNDIVDSQVCRHENGHWEGGFDISGHFCFLINISLILWIELHHLDQWIKDHSINWVVIYKYDKIVLYLEYIVLGVLSAWIFLLMTTSIFYHTWSEKVLGFLMGHLCPIVIYYLMP